MIEISQQEIKFLAKDRRLRREMIVHLTPKEFLAAWTQHIPAHHEHAAVIRAISPRAIGNNSAAVLAILGQSSRPRLRALSWSVSIKCDFGWDPLLDRNGNRMTWNRRIAPEPA